MSRLVFDGMQHTITLYKSNFEIVGTWTAFNRIDNAVKTKTGFTHLQDGIYMMQDRSVPHRHINHEDDTINGKYGTYGIVRFYMIGHSGVGVHSGRAFHHRLPGPRHPTQGCIRTTEEAMKAIKDLMHQEPLETLTVYNNLPQYNLQ